MEVVARTFQFNQNIGIQAKDHEKKKHYKNTWLASVNDLSLVPVNYKTAHASPLSKPLGIWLFWKFFFQIPGYVSSLDGQMPH